MQEFAYIFLDEAGNLDFSAKGTKYFSIASVFTTRPFPADGALHSLRFDLIQEGFDLEYFHASEDKQQVRDRVFGWIQPQTKWFKADSIIVEKPKAAPQVRDEMRFYPEILGYLLRYVINGLVLDTGLPVVVITDRLPINKRKKAFEKAIKTTLARMLPPTVPYRILHHDSKSCEELQIADYINWAIFRKWERDDKRSYDLIRDSIRSEFDIYQRGSYRWYEYP